MVFVVSIDVESMVSERPAATIRRYEDAVFIVRAKTSKEALEEVEEYHEEIIGFTSCQLVEDWLRDLSDRENAFVELSVGEVN